MNFVVRIGRHAALVALYVWVVGPVLAQTSPSPKVERPTVKVGDSWTYDRIDNWTKSKEFTTVTVVMSVDEKEIRLEAKRADNGDVSTISRNRDLNNLVIASPDGKALSDPYDPNYAFPLEVGKAWEGKVTYTRSSEPDRLIVATLTGKAIGWEQVSVPAGSFNALKIEVTGFYNGSNAQGRWNGQIFRTIWYVPELKHAARWTYRDSGGFRGRFSDYTWELVAYDLAR